MQPKSDNNSLKSCLPCFIPLSQDHNTSCEEAEADLNKWRDSLPPRVALDPRFTGREKIEIQAPTAAVAGQIFMLLTKRNMEVIMGLSTHDKAKANFSADINNIRLEQQIIGMRRGGEVMQVECKFQSIKLLLKHKTKALEVTMYVILFIIRCFAH